MARLQQPLHTSASLRNSTAALDREHSSSARSRQEPHAFPSVKMIEDIYGGVIQKGSVTLSQFHNLGLAMSAARSLAVPPGHLSTVCEPRRVAPTSGLSRGSRAKAAAAFPPGQARQSHESVAPSAALSTSLRIAATNAFLAFADVNARERMIARS